MRQEPINMFGNSQNLSFSAALNLSGQPEKRSRDAAWKVNENRKSNATHIEVNTEKENDERECEENRVESRSRILSQKK